MDLQSLGWIGVNIEAMRVKSSVNQRQAIPVFFTAAL